MYTSSFTQTLDWAKFALCLATGIAPHKDQAILQCIAISMSNFIFVKISSICVMKNYIPVYETIHCHPDVQEIQCTVHGSKNN